MSSNNQSILNDINSLIQENETLNKENARLERALNLHFDDINIRELMVQCLCFPKGIIGQIKSVRALTGYGLKEAKELVETVHHDIGCGLAVDNVKAAIDNGIPITIEGASYKLVKIASKEIDF